MPSAFREYVFQKTFDSAGRMLSGTLPGGSSNFGYDAFGRVESIVHPGSTGNFQQDLLNRITQVTWTGATPISQAMGFDLAGNITQLERENSSASTLAYDAVDQILSSVGGSAEVRSYTRDLLGNRLQDSQNGAGTFISNFLMSNGLATYQADPNGFGEIVQEVKAGVTKNYTYRADGQLSGFQSGSTQVASYYDALGRLAARAINDGTSTYTQSYAYIGREPTLLQAKAGDGTITTYLSGQGPNDYRAESKNGGYKGYVTDHAGSILNSDLAGPTHRYSLHGEPTGSATLSSASSPAMLGWQGLRFNPESGNWDNLFRDYNPAQGTFTSQDPIDISGGINLYGSRKNNPLRYVDIDGASAKDVKEIYRRYRERESQMTAAGERHPDPQVNNRERTKFNWGLGGHEYKGCGEQAIEIQLRVDSKYYEDHWDFEVRGSDFFGEDPFSRTGLRIGPHYWLEGTSSNPFDPKIILDPWRDKTRTEKP